MTRLALVTGGTRGIGASISIGLYEAGYKVAANYAQNDSKAREFAKEYGVSAYKWDVTDFNACIDNVKRIEDDFGQEVSILINNAGIIRDGVLHKMEQKNWQEVVDTNLSTCFNTCRAVINSMRDNNFGRIVNISSINALCGQVGQTNYAAAKAGVLGFTKSLAKENAAKNITVNAIAPGYIKTDMLGAIADTIIETIVKQIPVRRLGKPEEIARAVLFLVHEDAGFITGETLSINGGHHME
jgi:acetoacetyl-CoA reductase